MAILPIEARPKIFQVLVIVLAYLQRVNFSFSDLSEKTAQSLQIKGTRVAIFQSRSKISKVWLVSCVSLFQLGDVFKNIDMHK